MTKTRLRFVTGYDHNNNFKVITAPEGSTIDESEWDEYVFQFAKSEAEAESQHDDKFQHWQRDNNTGAHIKTTY